MPFTRESEYALLGLAVLAEREVDATADPSDLQGLPRTSPAEYQPWDDLSEALPRHLQCPQRVKLRKARYEQMFSALPPTTDIDRRR